MSAHKRYIGDGVYADVNDIGDLVLTTENGIEVTNTIVVEPEVLAALLKFIDRVITARDGLPL